MELPTTALDMVECSMVLREIFQYATPSKDKTCLQSIQSRSQQDIMISPLGNNNLVPDSNLVSRH